MDFTTVYVYGCSPDQYILDGNRGAFQLSLRMAGFQTHYKGSTTLLEVITHAGSGTLDANGVQTYDAFLVQAVTAYLNSLYVSKYVYNTQEVLDGYHDGTVSEATFKWNNNGAFGRDTVAFCDLD